MSYLKSQDNSGRRALGKRIITETSSSTSLPSSFRFGPLKPCSSEKLLPPMQLMTKERSFRHLYCKYHPPATTIPKMNFLQKREDPVLKKKRELIYERIRTAELASEQLKREKEQRNNEGLSLSDHSGHDESQDGSGTYNEVSNMRQMRGRGSFVNGVVVSGFVSEERKTDIQLPDTTTSSSNSCCEDTINDDEAYSFSFIADWKKESMQCQV